MPFKKRSEMTPEEVEADKARRTAAGQKRRAASTGRRPRAAAPAAILDPIAEIETGDGEETDFDLDDLLSDAEIAEIYAQAKKKVAEERRKQRVKAIYDKALNEERKNAGLLDRSEEERAQLSALTQVTIDLPRFRNQRDIPYLRIDGRGFYHGRTYTVTVAEARSIYEMMGRQRLHMAQFNGDSRSYFDPRQGKSIYMGGAAAGGALLGSEP